MTIDLTKRTTQTVDLGRPGLHRIFIRFRWEAGTAAGPPVDCDLSAVMLSPEHVLPSKEYLVFYNNLLSADGAVRHLGDHREALGGAHGELIQVDLPQVSPGVSWILLVVSISDAAERSQTLGSIQNALTTLQASEDGPILHAHSIPATAANGDACIVARLGINERGDWSYEAVAEPFLGGLVAIRDMYHKG